MYVELPPGYEIYNKVSSLDINQLDINYLTLIDSLKKSNKSLTLSVTFNNSVLYNFKKSIKLISE